jgi:hypothetical protein
MKNEATVAPPPLGLLVLGCKWTLTWQRDGADAQVACQLIVVQREERSIGGQDVRHMRERRLVMRRYCTTSSRRITSTGSGQP